MRPKILYNENNRAKAAWLRHLIEEGVIAHGVVDERPIQAIQPEDLDGVVQFHAFAGIGLWSLCLRRAGWPDDRPIWTGSCPCGPFSAAGLRKGFDDPRHLWPEWFRLISVRWPGVLFGEQSADADAWLDLVQSNMEGIGYAFGAADIPAAGFGGAHRRQRFGFVADADHTQWWTERAPWHDGGWPQTGRVKSNGHLGERGMPIGLGYANHERRNGLQEGGQQAGRRELADASSPGRVANTYGGKPWNGHLQRSREHGQLTQDGGAVDWLLCRDARWRPVEPGTCPLVDASPARLGRLRGYGDAIDVEAFTNLIAAYMEIAP